jgi:hypothetical protein
VRHDTACYFFLTQKKEGAIQFISFFFLFLISLLNREKVFENIPNHSAIRPIIHEGGNGSTFAADIFEMLLSYR